MRDTFLLEKFYKNYKLRYFWIFLTEKCNLNCDYCFYKYKDKSTSLSYDDFLKIIDTLQIEKNTEFILSGGEPLLEPLLLKKIVKKIRKKHPDNYILLQTNTILLDNSILDMLKRYTVNVEIGLDGEFFSNKESRQGTNENRYNNIMKSLDSLSKADILHSCTMTVHPTEVENMFDNFLFLLTKSFSSIEITPAAFEKWDKKSIYLFKKNYLRCIKYSIENSLLTKLSAGYDKIMPKSTDAIITAKAVVLPNWSLLSLPTKKKEEYSIFSISKDKIIVNKEGINKYDKLLKSFYSCKRSYREYSTFIAELAYNELKLTHLDGYKEINNYLKKLHTKYLLR